MSRCRKDRERIQDAFSQTELRKVRFFGGVAKVRPHRA
ncbi:hypothetical protein Y025_5731 [Burkholderia pseudomallei TSV32]|nr:hypothetical protein Y025_5731 [Burkholderia pseudomallei TSV32]